MLQNQMACPIHPIAETKYSSKRSQNKKTNPLEWGGSRQESLNIVVFLFGFLCFFGFAVFPFFLRSSLLHGSAYRIRRDHCHTLLPRPQAI